MFTGLGTVGRLGQGVGGGGWGGCQVSSLRRTAEKWDSVIQSEAELNRQLSQIITCLSEAISIYVKLCKAISSQLFFPSGCRAIPAKAGLPRQSEAVTGAGRGGCQLILRTCRRVGRRRCRPGRL